MSKTVGQHSNKIGSMSRVCWAVLWHPVTNCTNYNVNVFKLQCYLPQKGSMPKCKYNQMSQIMISQWMYCMLVWNVYRYSPLVLKSQTCNLNEWHIWHFNSKSVKFILCLSIQFLTHHTLTQQGDLYLVILYDMRKFTRTVLSLNRYSSGTVDRQILMSKDGPHTERTEIWTVSWS